MYADWFACTSHLMASNFKWYQLRFKWLQLKHHINEVILFFNKMYDLAVTVNIFARHYPLGQSAPIFIELSLVHNKSKTYQAASPFWFGCVLQPAISSAPQCRLDVKLHSKMSSDSFWTVPYRMFFLSCNWWCSADSKFEHKAAFYL